MAQAVLELEGTWEEIAAHAPEFAGHRLRLTVFAEDSPIDNSWMDDPRLQFLREIEERSRFMNPKQDEVDLLREGRAGAMYGE